MDEVETTHYCSSDSKQEVNGETRVLPVLQYMKVKIIRESSNSSCLNTHIVLKEYTVVNISHPRGENDIIIKYELN